MSAHPIWQKLDELFQNQTWTNWLSPIQALTSNDVKLDALARSAKTLADLYANNSNQSMRPRALGYGLLAAQAYLKMGRVAPAMAMNDWIKSIPDSRGIVEYLESEVSRLVCNSPTSQSENSLYETRVQDREAIDSIRESFRSEKTLAYPKATYPFFSELPMEEVSALINKAKVRSFKAGEKVFQEGDEPDSFYLIAEGSIEISSRMGFQKNFEEGEFFGELGVLGNMNRTASATATQESTLIEFSKVLLVETFIQFPALEQKILRYFYLRLFLNKVRQDEVFKSLPEKDYLDFFYTFKPGFIKAGKTLFDRGDFSNSFYYLLAGEWEVKNADGRCVVQGPGNFVGERGFIQKKPRNASVTARTDCHYLSCDEGMFKNFGKNFPNIETILKRLAEQRQDPSQTDPAMFVA